MCEVWKSEEDGSRSIGSSKKERPFDRFNFSGFGPCFFLHGCHLGGIPVRESVALLRSQSSTLVPHNIRIYRTSRWCTILI